MFEFGRANRVVYDYTEKGALNSIEGSLNRLGVDRLDFVFVHDPAQDFHGNAWLAQLETARTGAFRALTRLREEGVIKGWGLGVNLAEPVEFTLGLTEAQPDSTLLAGRYTLLDHEHALQRLMPTAPAQGVDIVIGGPYNSGILAGGTRFEYQTAPAEISAKVARITDIAQRHNAPIKAAALQFSLAHPATAAVIPGASKPERIAEDYAALIPRSPTTSGTKCATNTSSPPTRRYPSTDNPGTPIRRPRRLQGVVCGLAGVGVVGLVDGRSPAGEQVESIVRGRSGLGAVGGEGQAGIGWEFHGLVVEAEFADHGVVVSLEPGSIQAHVVGGPPLAEGLTARGKSPTRSDRLRSNGFRPASVRKRSTVESTARSQSG